MIDVAAVTHFPDVLRAFRTERHDVDLTLSVAPSRTLLADLERGALDLVVCVEPPSHCRHRHGGAAQRTARGLRPARRDDRSTVDVGAVGVVPRRSHTRHAVAASLAALGAPLDVAAESHQPDVLREMVLLGLGWTVLPRSQGELGPVELTIGEQVVERRLVLARRRDAIADPAVDELADRLLRRTG